MRGWLIIVSVFFCTALHAQTVADPEFKFHEAANLYINKDYDKALASVKEGLRLDPKSQRLEELRKLLEKEKKDQQKKDQQNKEQKEKEDKQKQEQQKKEQQEKEQQEKKEQDEKNKQDQKDKNEQEKKEDEKKENEEKEKDKEQESKPEDEKEKEEKDKRLPNFDQQKIPQISEEKARMILEAMRNQEKQYLQQQKRKSQKRKDPGKPDW